MTTSRELSAALLAAALAPFQAPRNGRPQRAHLSTWKPDAARARKSRSSS